jgi:hypothetical protein
MRRYRLDDHGAGFCGDANSGGCAAKSIVEGGDSRSQSSGEK